MITVLLRPEDLSTGGPVKIVDDTYRHLFRARRLRAGARVRAVDGLGRARWAEVEGVERRQAVLSLAATAPDNEPAYSLHLLVAALRSERASWLVEKATEIGVRSIRFITTERTPRKGSPASLERLCRVARAAVEQSHRSRVPEIAGVEPWKWVTASLRDGPLAVNDRYILDFVALPPPEGTQTGNPSKGGQTGKSSDEGQTRSPLTGGQTGSNEPWRAQGDSGVVLVGPEGGWSRPEARELEQLGCKPVSLGARILRVETAAIVAAAKLLL